MYEYAAWCTQHCATLSLPAVALWFDTSAHVNTLLQQSTSCLEATAKAMPRHSLAAADTTLC
jgi:hypothetical protein